MEPAGRDYCLPAWRFVRRDARDPLPGRGGEPVAPCWRQGCALFAPARSLASGTKRERQRDRVRKDSFGSHGGAGTRVDRSPRAMSLGLVRTKVRPAGWAPPHRHGARGPVLLPQVPGVVARPHALRAHLARGVPGWAQPLVVEPPVVPLEGCRAPLAVKRGQARPAGSKMGLEVLEADLPLAPRDGVGARDHEVLYHLPVRKGGGGEGVTIGAHCARVSTRWQATEGKTCLFKKKVPGGCAVVYLHPADRAFVQGRLQAGPACDVAVSAGLQGRRAVHHANRTRDHLSVAVFLGLVFASVCRHFAGGEPRALKAGASRARCGGSAAKQHQVTV